MTSTEFKETRLRLGMTQAQLGAFMGMNQAAIARIETTRQPTKKDAAFINHLVQCANTLKRQQQ